MNYFNKLIADFHIPKTIGAEISGRMKTQDYPMGAILVKQSELDPYLRIIVQGALCAYNYDDEGKFHVYWIATEKQLVFSSNEFLEETPSPENIKTLEPTTLYLIQKTDWLLLCNAYPKVEAVHYRLMQLLLLQQDRWEKLRRLSSPEAKIQKFYQLYGDMRNRIPQIYLAAWLEMHESTFSKAQKKLIQSKLV